MPISKQGGDTNRHGMYKCCCINIILNQVKPFVFVSFVVIKE